MHLLAARAGAIQQDGEAIDLGQSPGRIIFASAADSELAALAAAADRAGEAGLRLANFMRLGNNLSVDVWLDKTVRHAQLIVVRLLGGAAYWSYGVDELCRLAEETGAQLALLSGDANPDPVLLARSTTPPDIWHRLHALFAAGGPDNLDRALGAMQALADGKTLADTAPEVFPEAGLWWPGEGLVDADRLDTLNEGEAPAYVPILFYRAVLDGAGTATLEALVRALAEAGLAPVPVMVSSLKQTSSVDFVRDIFARFAPEAIFNLTGFALGLGGLAAATIRFPTLMRRSSSSSSPGGLRRSGLGMRRACRPRTSPCRWFCPRSTGALAG